MHVRDVPDDVHEELQRRAIAQGMTLRQYTIDVLSRHCALPTTDQWLDSLARRRLTRMIDSASAVEASRADDASRLRRA